MEFEKRDREEEEAYASITESQKRVWLEDEAYTSIFDLHGIAAEIEKSNHPQKDTVNGADRKPKDARKKKEEEAYASITESEKRDWEERHYKIAQESAKKFETHTKDQEVDISSVKN